MSENVFRKSNVRSEASGSKSPTSNKLLKLVKSCLVCKKDLSGHQFVEIASTTISEENKPRVHALYNHVKNHEWSAVAEFTDFRGDLDDVIVEVIEGPHSGGMAILYRDPFELYAEPELYLSETLTDGELSTISKLVRKGWHYI